MENNVPQFTHFLKNPIHVVAYILLLYFVYKEFTKKDECAELRVVITRYEILMQNQDKRIQALEGYLFVKDQVINKIEYKLDSATNATAGGAK